MARSLRSKLISVWFDECEKKTSVVRYRHRLRALSAIISDYYANKHGKKLNENPVFYTYVLLDTTKPGNYSYDCPSGRSVNYAFEPYYVGKGKGGRVYSHLRRARKLNDELGDRVAHILKAGGEQGYVFATFPKRSESMSLAIEMDLIAGIGRISKRSGPLLNRSSGGTGASDYVTTEEVRKIRSDGMNNRYRQRTKSDHKKYSVLIKAGLGRMTEESKDAKKLSGKKSTAIEYRCPYCSKDGKGPNMLFYHFNNCPKNPHQPEESKDAQVWRAMKQVVSRDKTIR